MDFQSFFRPTSSPTPPRALNRANLFLAALISSAFMAPTAMAKSKHRKSEDEIPVVETANPVKESSAKKRKKSEQPPTYNEPSVEMPAPTAPYEGSKESKKSAKKSKPSETPPERITETPAPVIKRRASTVEKKTRQDGTPLVIRNKVNKSGISHSTTYYKNSDGSKITERDNGTKTVHTNQTKTIGKEKTQIERRQISYKSGKNISYEKEIHSKSITIKKTVIYNNITVINNYNYLPYNYGRNRYYFYSTPYEFWWQSRVIIYEPWSHPYGYPWSYNVPWYHPVTRYYTSYDWLTDYFFMTLWDQEEAAMEASISQAEEARYREEISEEVRAQVQIQVREALEAYKAKTPLTINPIIPAGAGIVEKPEYIFTVHQDMSVIDDGGDKCMLSDGDLIKLKADQKISGDSAIAIVVTGKSDSCDAGSEVHISLADLQSMQNEFAQRIEAGAKSLTEQMP